ncbi:ISAzo13-like element transposase-related protein [Bathymodiolus platifrons methanotrophic gill symbiont]|uniref:ISAzo13-like element transposase-related protein n=1 Tax=Bathymodiolus platifrons methanotrophic gill symbiont TaxID=113268 RepID=UPI0030B80C9B
MRTGYNRNQTTWRRSKKKTSTPEYSGIDQDFLDILQQHTAGNPMNSSIRWTYLKPREIVSELLKKGYSVSRNIVRYLLN